MKMVFADANTDTYIFSMGSMTMNNHTNNPFLLNSNNGYFQERKGSDSIVRVLLLLELERLRGSWNHDKEFQFHRRLLFEKKTTFI
jgi:hypothetical protein